MKELKDLADKEKSEMLDEDFLETTLYPIVDANKAKRKANRKRKAVSIITGVYLELVWESSFTNAMPKLMQRKNPIFRT